MRVGRGGGGGGLGGGGEGVPPLLLITDITCALYHGQTSRRNLAAGQHITRCASRLKDAVTTSSTAVFLVGVSPMCLRTCVNE